MIRIIFNIFFAVLFTSVIGFILFWLLVFLVSSVYHPTDSEGYPEGGFTILFLCLLITIFASVFLFLFFYKSVANETKNWS
ncbi:MAG: hypothetical protein ACOVO1_10310 [Chitinophagaceae bacterium]